MFKQILFGTTCLLGGLLLGIAGSNFAQVSIEAGYADCRHTSAPDGWLS